MRIFSSRAAVVALVLAAAVMAGGCGQIGKIKAKMAVKKANPAYTAQDYKTAAGLYEEALQDDPSLTDLYFFLGNSYENQFKPSKKGEPENDAFLPKAAQNYRTAIDKLRTTSDPKEQQVRRWAFEYLISLYGPDRLNDFDKAEPVAKELIAIDPNDPTTYRILAKLYEDQGRIDEAEAQFLKAIEVAPKDAAGYQFLAAFYNRQGNFEKTMEAWNRRAQAEPNNPEAWHTIGVYYQDKVFRDKKLPSKVALEYTMKGLEAEDKALSISHEYFEALTYKNILMRQQALYEKDPKRVKELLQEADALRDQALAIQKKQNIAAGSGSTPAAGADAKKGGSK